MSRIDIEGNEEHTSNIGRLCGLNWRLWVDERRAINLHGGTVQSTDAAVLLRGAAKFGWVVFFSLSKKYRMEREREGKGCFESTGAER